MTRKLASIVTIASSDPIPDSDRLSVVKMAGKGWNVVTQRDEFKPGDLAVYFEIDSYLPADDPRYEFLKTRCLKKFVSSSGQTLKEGILIKTCKLRGVISQGLLAPIAGNYPELSDVTDGQDVTELLRVEHYDEVAESLRDAIGGTAASDEVMGKFPSAFIPKTDEERIQNLGDYFDTMKGRIFEVTEKNDGASATIFLSKIVDEENPFGVCSRNMRLKPEWAKGVPVQWQIAKKYDMAAKLEQINAMFSCEFAFQGELVGPGVNRNRDKYTDLEWHVFKIWDITNQRYLNPNQAQNLCLEMGIPYVPVINSAMKAFDELTTMEAILEFAEGKTARGHEREGVVFKSVDDKPFVSFKVVSNRYLLKQKD